MAKLKSHAKQKLDPLLRSIIGLQKRKQLFPPDARTVVVGVSGGADSVCLLHLLANMKNSPADLHLDLHIAHLDHSLRAESCRDAIFVQELTTILGLPCTIETLTNGQLASEATRGIEDAARHARYTFFERVASNVTPAGKVPCIAMAHNADDQAETVLMNFLRGSGIDGLGGMRWISPLPVAIDSAVQVVRPLLDTPRAEILAYLARHNLRWREDGTNSDRKFLRNRIRHDVLPLLQEINPDLLHTLGRTADIMRAEAIRIHQMDAQTLARITAAESMLPGESEAKRILLDLAKLQTLNTAAMRNVLRLALQQIGTDARDIQFSIIESLAQMVQSMVGTVVAASGPNPLVNDLCWTILPAAGPRKNALLSLHQSNQFPCAVEHPLLDHGSDQNGSTQGGSTQNSWVLHSRTIQRSDLPVNWQAHDPWSAYMDQAVVNAPQLCTLADAAPKFAPLGMGGQHKSISDFFTDRKVLPAARARWPLIAEAETGRVLWVCGLQLAHEARITEETQQVLHLWWAKRTKSTPDERTSVE